MLVFVVVLHHEAELPPGENLEAEVLAVCGDQPASLERGEAAGPEPSVALSADPPNLQTTPAPVTNNLHLHLLTRVLLVLLVLLPSLTVDRPYLALGEESAVLRLREREEMPGAEQPGLVRLTHQAGPTSLLHCNRGHL